jgi:hypothetical protein
MLWLHSPAALIAVNGAIATNVLGTRVLRSFMIEIKCIAGAHGFA